jgi:hypothetical protein
MRPPQTEDGRNRENIEQNDGKRHVNRQLAARRRSAITATESAPASKTALAVSRVIPPMPTSGLRVALRAALNPSRPTTGSGFALLRVAKTGP